MATVTLPYKLQVWLPDELRKQLKDLARQHDMTLQNLVVTVLEDATSHPPAALDQARQRREATV